jgi:hypothetical protein
LCLNLSSLSVCLCDSFRRLRKPSVTTPPPLLQRLFRHLCKRQVVPPPQQTHAISVLCVHTCSFLTAACRARLALRAHFPHDIIFLCPRHAPEAPTAAVAHPIS